MSGVGSRNEGKEIGIVGILDISRWYCHVRRVLCEVSSDESEFHFME